MKVVIYFLMREWVGGGDDEEENRLQLISGYAG